MNGIGSLGCIDARRAASALCAARHTDTLRSHVSVCVCACVCVRVALSHNTVTHTQRARSCMHSTGPTATHCPQPPCRPSSPVETRTLPTLCRFERRAAARDRTPRAARTVPQPVRAHAHHTVHTTHNTCAANGIVHSAPGASDTSRGSAKRYGDPRASLDDMRPELFEWLWRIFMLLFTFCVVTASELMHV
jgi:hypothetical protein